ncbi:MAG: TusE/DsrC/DsvC family sulfur relay protein [Nitrospiraceae bacterium]|nr:TusE/DsrC/DsvC family sulfur relay protein [Nitrospiraceae bacterium]
MQEAEHKGMKFTLDDDGYLVNMDDWNETIASALAEREGIGELTADKMAILKFMRDYYREYNFFPILRFVCKNVGQPRNCVTEKFIEPVLAWKIAGLPNPGDEVNAMGRWEPLGF